MEEKTRIACGAKGMEFGAGFSGLGLRVYRLGLRLKGLGLFGSKPLCLGIFAFIRVFSVRCFECSGLGIPRWVSRSRGPSRI